MRAFLGDSVEGELAEWQELNSEITEFRETVMKREMVLRKKLFDKLFPSPTEGVNKTDCGGMCAKGTYKLTRSIDIAALQSVATHLENKGVDLDELVEYKPQLVLAAYRKLSDADRKLFDQCLEIKPAAPSLEILIQKEI